MNEIAGKDGQRRWRDVLFEVIFEADTPAGKWFDIILILCIVLSVAVVMLDSVGSVNAEHGGLLKAAEWFFTILFTIEYILRLLCAGRAIRYAVSFFGIVDLSRGVDRLSRLSVYINGESLFGIIFRRNVTPFPQRQYKTLRRADMPFAVYHGLKRYLSARTDSEVIAFLLIGTLRNDRAQIPRVCSLCNPGFYREVFAQFRRIN